MSALTRTRPPQLTRPPTSGRERRIGGLALAGALVVAALVVGRFQTDDDGERFGLVSQAPSTNPALAELATAPEVGKLAPNFRLVSLDGGSVELADLRGRPVYLAFWTIDCVSCATQLSSLQSLVDTHGDQVEVLGVNGGDPSDLVLAIATAQQTRYPLLLDPDRKVTNAHGIQTLPTSLMLDADGVIRSIDAGPLSLEQMEERLAPLLTA